MHRPTAVPRIPASASGVSTHRSSPNRSRSPAVARKTPPARPTSSPITITESSRASSVCSASLTASRSVSSAKPALAQSCRRIDVRVLEDQLGVGRRLGLGSSDPFAHRTGRLGPHRLDRRLVEQPGPLEVPLVPAEALVLLLLLHALGIDVHGGIVGRRVRRGAV